MSDRDEWTTSEEKGDQKEAGQRGRRRREWNRTAAPVRRSRSQTTVPKDSGITGEGEGEGDDDRTEWTGASQGHSEMAYI